MRKVILCIVSTLAVEIVTASPNAMPHLYELKNGTKTFYLLGTFHAEVSLSDYPQSIFEHIDAADVVFFETAFPSTEVNSISNYYLGFISKIVESEQIPSATLLPRTRESLIQYGIPDSLVNYVNNENCSIFMSICFHLRSPGLDIQILKYAYNNEKNIEELDSDSLRSEPNQINNNQENSSSCDLNIFFRSYKVEQIHNWENSRVQVYKFGRRLSNLFS